MLIPDPRNAVLGWRSIAAFCVPLMLSFCPPLSLDNAKNDGRNVDIEFGSFDGGDHREKGADGQETPCLPLQQPLPVPPPGTVIMAIDIAARTAPASRRNAPWLSCMLDARRFRGGEQGVPGWRAWEDREGEGMGRNGGRDRIWRATLSTSSTLAYRRRRTLSLGESN